MNESNNWLEMTREEKKAQIVEYLTEWHLDLYGGYPCDYCWMGKTLIVAGLDPGKECRRTQLKIYDGNKIQNWIRRADTFARDYPNEMPQTIIGETQH